MQYNIFVQRIRCTNCIVNFGQQYPSPYFELIHNEYFGFAKYITVTLYAYRLLIRAILTEKTYLFLLFLILCIFKKSCQCLYSDSLFDLKMYKTSWTYSTFDKIQFKRSPYKAISFVKFYIASH